MWPSYLLFKKREYAEESDEEKSDLIESYRYEQSPRDGKYRLSALPCSHFVEVPHINQLHSWDCGLACVLMVFRTVGIDSCDIQTLADLCCTNRMMTLEFVHQSMVTYLSIALGLNINSSLYEEFLIHLFGANPNYSGETFYKEQLPNDLVRVDTLFQKALEAGIRIKCRSVSREEICFLILCGKYIAIVLVDQYKLSPSNQDNVIISDLCGSNSDYTGHYVIVCGYDTATDEFEIRDPACSRKHERVSSTCLEEARKSFGTDEDLLLISLRKSRKPDCPSIQLSRNDNNDS